MLVDLLIVFIITISIIVSFKKGFALSVFNMLSSVFSVALVSLLYTPITEGFKRSYLGNMLSDSVRNYVSGMFEQSENAVVSSDAPEFIKFFLTENQTVSEAVNGITDKIVGIVVGVAAFILVIVASKLIVKFMPKIIDVISKIPLIKQANKLLGIVSGTVMGVVWSFLVVYVAGLLSLIPSMEFLDSQISRSVIVSVFNGIF
jgi:uncharacterized membrane protein required for colicin V production